MFSENIIKLSCCTFIKIPASQSHNTHQSIFKEYFNHFTPPLVWHLSHFLAAKRSAAQHLHLCSVCLSVRLSVSKRNFSLFGQLMTTYDALWQLMTAYDILWQLMTTYNNLWQLMTAYDNLWQIMTTFENCWQFLTTVDNFWQILTDFDNLWHFFDSLEHLLTAYDSFWQVMT